MFLIRLPDSDSIGNMISQDARFSFLLLFLLCLAFIQPPLSGSEPTAAPDFELAPFGIGSSALRSRDHPKWLPQMAEIGIKDIRSVGGGWGGVEAEKGTYNFQTLDEKLAFAQSQGIVSGMLFLGSPKWNTKDNPRGLPMNALPEWSAYVAKTVEHTKGRVKYFEIWNEPPNGTANAPASDYGKLVAASYEAAKESNPDAQVGLAAKSVHINYLEKAIQGGAKDHFDYITLHPYEVLGCIEETPGTEPIYMAIVPTVRKMLAAQNPAKVNVPVVLTEIGYDSKRGADRQANALVKAYTMGIAQGMACIQWFEGMDGDSGPLGLLKADGTIRPAYIAMGQMIKHMGKRPVYLGWILLNEKHYGFVFQGPNGTVLSTWAASSTPEDVNFGQDVELVDTYTGTSSRAATYKLSTKPVLVLGVPDTLVAQAKANKDKPLTWGGDYTNAKEVSVTMGEKNVERGLHTKSADSIAADVLAYGGNARAGDVPGGNVFIVDPNFLSYTSTPIEIRMVVKRNDKNDPAKLTMEYESTNGYKKLPEFEIPDGKDWTTASWKIDDAQFVNMWAFNFRVNKGKYLVQSVTVSKR